MNYIRHLHAFYQHIKRDKRLSANHVSLYLALFEFWNYNRFQNPFRINREALMQLSKIGSKNTYHKCIKELHSYQYIFYHTVVSKYQHAKVSIIRLENKTTEKDLQQLGLFNPDNDTGESTGFDTHSSTIFDTHACPKNDTQPVPVLTATCPKNGTEPVPILGHLLKHKQIKHKRERENNTLTQIISVENNLSKEKINAPRRVPNSVQQQERNLPLLPEIEVFFQTNNYPVSEVKKFFNHYQSNGWLVGGKAPMKNWQSSADKWMLNIDNFKQVQNAKSGKQQNKDLDTGPGKNYSEPL
jgi:hypothetical protein